MPLDFPNYPGIGDEFFGFVFDGVRWIARGTTALPWLPLTGGQMSGPISLAGNAAMPLEAVPLQQVQGLVDADISPAMNNVGRNLLHNGLFNINQRGMGPFTTNGANTSDRWKIGLLAPDTMTVGLLLTDDTARAGIGDEAVNYLLSVQVTSGTTSGESSVMQLVEDVRRLAGRTVTVSFWCGGTAGVRIGVSIDQVFGAGGSASVLGAGQSVPQTGAYVRQSLTFAIPSAAGKTLGAGHSTQLNLWFSAGSAAAGRAGIGVQSGSFFLWGVQLEIGTQATPLEKLDPQLDLANCQRFFQTSSVPYVLFGHGLSGNFQGWVPVNLTLPVVMRAMPTVVLAFGGQGTSGWSLTAYNITAIGLSVWCATQAPAGATAATSFSYTASADL